VSPPGFSSGTGGGLLVTEGAYVPKVWAASRASQIEGELRISLSSVDDQTVEQRINCSSVCPSPVASQIEGEPDFRRVTVELTFWKWRFDTRSTSEMGLGAKIAGAEIAGVSTVLTVGISPLVEIVGRRHCKTEVWSQCQSRKH
jgi:hypothetical protein